MSKKKKKSKSSFNYKKFVPVFKPMAIVNYVLLTALSVVLVLITIIALPMTENFYPDISLNLEQKAYINKSYVVELRIKIEDKEDLNRKIEETKAILTKRLYKIGVEQVSITGHHLNNPTPDDQDYLYRYIQVTVRTTVAEEEVDQVVRNRNYMRLYSLIDGFNYEDEENPVAQYLIENYNPSSVTRHDFRTLHFKQLLDSNQDQTYFALFKSAYFNSDFQQFASDNAGKDVGVAIDGLIAQVPMSLEFSESYAQALSASGQAPRPQFALGITQDEREKEIADVLFNAGVIPVEYNLVGQTPVETEDVVKQPTYFAVVLLAGLLLYAYFTGQQEEVEGSQVFRNLFEMLLVLIVWLAYLKFMIVPVEINILMLEVIALLFFAHELQSLAGNHTSRVVIFFVSTVLLALLGFGQVQQFAMDLSILMVGLVISKPLSKYYLDNIRDYLLNE